MRSDTHSAALRAAAKVAFSVAFIGGCSAPASPGDLADDTTDGTYGDGVEPGSSESEVSAKKKPKQPAQLSVAPCDKHKDAGPPKPLTCEQVVNAAFPTEGQYPGTKQNVSIEVQNCCAEHLLADNDGLGTHRWDCCANLPADAGQNISIACTPWGPPVPPSMKRRSKTEPKPESWVADMLAVA